MILMRRVQFFSFVKCATDLPVLFNAESKVNPVDPGATKTPEEFVRVSTHTS
jgi:hypothetical protein